MTTSTPYHSTSHSPHCGTAVKVGTPITMTTSIPYHSSPVSPPLWHCSQGRHPNNHDYQHTLSFTTPLPPLWHCNQRRHPNNHDNQHPLSFITFITHYSLGSHCHKTSFFILIRHLADTAWHHNTFFQAESSKTDCDITWCLWSIRNGLLRHFGPGRHPNKHDHQLLSVPLIVIKQLGWAPQNDTDFNKNTESHKLILNKSLYLNDTTKGIH